MLSNVGLFRRYDYEQDRLVRSVCPTLPDGEPEPETSVWFCKDDRPLKAPVRETARLVGFHAGCRKGR